MDLVMKARTLHAMMITGTRVMVDVRPAPTIPRDDDDDWYDHDEREPFQIKAMWPSIHLLYIM